MAGEFAVVFHRDRQLDWPSKVSVGDWPTSDVDVGAPAVLSLVADETRQVGREVDRLSRQARDLLTGIAHARRYRAVALTEGRSCLRSPPGKGRIDGPVGILRPRLWDPRITHLHGLCQGATEDRSEVLGIAGETTVSPGEVHNRRAEAIGKGDSRAPSELAPGAASSIRRRLERPAWSRRPDPWAPPSPPGGPRP